MTENSFTKWNYIITALAIAKRDIKEELTPDLTQHILIRMYTIAFEQTAQANNKELMDIKQE